jgi:hypothetical protein
MCTRGLVIGAALTQCLTKALALLPRCRSAVAAAWWCASRALGDQGARAVGVMMQTRPGAGILARRACAAPRAARGREAAQVAPSCAREGASRTGSTADATVCCIVAQPLQAARCREQAWCLWNVMTTPHDSPSIELSVAAEKLRVKGHYARAAEKYGAAAAAAAQELAAKDCLVVTLLRTRQAYSIVCHCSIETLPAAEREAGRHTATELLPPCFSTLTRRKAARTLLPGSCRPTEVAWYWAFQTCGYRDAEARPLADALSVVVGTETYASAAVAALRVLTLQRGRSFFRTRHFLLLRWTCLLRSRRYPCLSWANLHQPMK